MFVFLLTGSNDKYIMILAEMARVTAALQLREIMLSWGYARPASTPKTTFPCWHSF